MFSEMKIIQAIKELEDMKSLYEGVKKGENTPAGQELEALDMAIEALRMLYAKQHESKPCSWCKADYTIIDNFGQPLHKRMIRFCWHCGRFLSNDD